MNETHVSTSDRNVLLARMVQVQVLFLLVLYLHGWPARCGQSLATT